MAGRPDGVGCRPRPLRDHDPRTVALPIIRGPVPLAKTLAAIDRLSGGRLVVAVGPGSSERDYAAVGIDFAERWQRLDEAIPALRALWQRPEQPFVGRFYSTAGMAWSGTSSRLSRAGMR